MLYGEVICILQRGGRNRIFIVSRDGIKQYVLRISDIGDRSEADYLGETEFVRYLAENGAPVADVIPSVNGRLVEDIEGAARCLIGSIPYAGIDVNGKDEC